MQCPQCGTRTEVIEKRGPYRDRRCKNANCQMGFTTREQIMRPRKQIVKPRQHGRLCARTRATVPDTALPHSTAEDSRARRTASSAGTDNEGTSQQPVAYQEAEVTA
jgi:hypothetical protein